jgi:hypothetical protein
MLQEDVMGKYITEQNAVAKSEPKGITKEEAELAGNIINFHQKAMEAGISLAGKMIDFQDKERDRKMRMAIYADKSMKWSENFEEIKKNNARMYSLMSKAFKDRRDTIDKAFEIIDRGLKENNMEVVLTTFGKMASMVAQSPLAEAAAAAHKLFESGRISELDPV